MKRAVVTGGTGFIGSWLIMELLKNSYQVTAIVRNSGKLIPEILDDPNCNVIEKNLNDVCKEDFSEDIYDCFFHLAWVGVSPENKNDELSQISNITMSIKALELCNKINCGLFIASGTVAEYSLCDDIMDVNARQTPNDMYSAAKVSTHYFLEVRARQLGQNFIWTVIPSTFGERRTGNNIITYTIRSLLRGEKPLYGDLNQMWDFLYVGEVAKALRLIGEKGKTGKIYGIGSGEYKPLKEYIKRIRDIVNPEIELGIGELPAMSKQTFSSCVNIYDLVRDTGFKPEISFDEGSIKTLAYIKNM